MPTQEKDVIACCSFCLKPNTEVKALVAGPAVFVCDGCVDLCCQIISALPEERTEPRLLPWEQTASLDAALANLPNVARPRPRSRRASSGGCAGPVRSAPPGPRSATPSASRANRPGSVSPPRSSRPVRMTRDDCWRVVRAADHGVLCTSNPKGTIDAVPVCFAVVPKMIVTPSTG